MKEEFRILSTTAILGYGFPKESFDEGMKRKPDLIAVDAGSTDPGPFYLGEGVSFTDREMCIRDSYCKANCFLSCLPSRHENAINRNKYYSQNHQADACDNQNLLIVFPAFQHKSLPFFSFFVRYVSYPFSLVNEMGVFLDKIPFFR